MVTLGKYQKKNISHESKDSKEFKTTLSWCRRQSSRTKVVSVMVPNESRKIWKGVLGEEKKQKPRVMYN